MIDRLLRVFEFTLTTLAGCLLLVGVSTDWTQL